MISRILITTGGTGGHIFPALAVAKLLQKQGVEVKWLGTRRGLESTIIPKHNIPLYYVDVVGLRGKGLKRLLVAPLQLLRAVYQAYRIVRRCNPDVVLAMGGFVSGPGGLAAWLLRKRLIIHEQNAVMGLTNQILSRFTSIILTGFPRVSKIKKTYKYVGNPVRYEITLVPEPETRWIEDKKEINLLIFGGSQGASVFNQVLPSVLAELSLEQKLHIWHQVGEGNVVKEVQDAYRKAQLNHVEVVPFIEDMAKAYRWADLVVCRSGASTIAELSAVGIASILVPFPQAVDDHQTMNAHFLVDEGGAILLSEKDFTSEKIKSILTALFSDRKRLIHMAKAARKLRKIDAIEAILEEIYGI